MNALETQKRLLIAESEINRALLIQECQSAAAEVHGLTQQAKHWGTLASSAALLAGSFFAFRNRKPPAANKRSWGSTLLQGLRWGSSLWPMLEKCKQRK